MALGLRPEALFGALSGWSSGQDQDLLRWSDLLAYIGLQAVVFAAISGGWLIAPLRRLLTPPGFKTARVRSAAKAQFEALGLTHTRDGTGVLIFASLADHRAEVLADAGIWTKTTPADWQVIAEGLAGRIAAGDIAGGFVQAVGEAGELLAGPFPRADDDRNELPDRLTVSPDCR